MRITPFLAVSYELSIANFISRIGIIFQMANRIPKDYRRKSLRVAANSDTIRDDEAIKLYF